jgi:hypothetical protein
MHPSPCPLPNLLRWAYWQWERLDYPFGGARWNDA